MLTTEPDRSVKTHEVTNQARPLVDYNVFDTDRALLEGIRAQDAAWGEDKLRAFGDVLGRARTIELGREANRYPPELVTHDRYGHRIDEVKYHPAYHEMMRIGIEHSAHCFAWNEPGPGAHVIRGAMAYMLGEIEAGVGCPISMTFSVVPALNHQSGIAAQWLPLITKSVYDPRFIPAHEKEAAQFGMAMTEKQGGSDVRANTTRAEPLNGGGPGAEYELTGHKWFCSAPMCDAFLTLAQTDAGLSCFLVPRFLPDGSRNSFFIQRLKDKLGNRSNASSEIEYNGTWAVMIGDDGRGVPTIIDMVAHTRLDCALFSAGLMHQAVAQAANHCRYRAAFGKVLNQQPLMQNVLADLAVEAEAATTTVMRLARSYDDAPNDAQVRDFSRLATAVTKYWICKRGPQHVYEALECHGGAGYVEESVMPRLYREAPLTSIWEGSGNVMCLDVLRAMAREPETVPAFLADVERARGGDPRLDRAIDRLKDTLKPNPDMERNARRLVESMAKVFQGTCLVRFGNPDVADAFCVSRLEGDHGLEYGTLPTGVAVDAIIERATPQY